MRQETADQLLQQTQEILRRIKHGTISPAIARAALRCLSIAILCEIEARRVTSSNQQRKFKKNRKPHARGTRGVAG